MIPEPGRDEIARHALDWTSAHVEKQGALAPV
jgi:hypothetical protein